MNFDQHIFASVDVDLYTALLNCRPRVKCRDLNVSGFVHWRVENKHQHLMADVWPSACSITLVLAQDVCVVVAVQELREHSENALL